MLRAHASLPVPKPAVKTQAGHDMPAGELARRSASTTGSTVRRSGPPASGTRCLSVESLQLSPGTCVLSGPCAGAYDSDLAQRRRHDACRLRETDSSPAAGWLRSPTAGGCLHSAVSRLWLLRRLGWAGLEQGRPVAVDIGELVAEQITRCLQGAKQEHASGTARAEVCARSLEARLRALL